MRGVINFQASGVLDPSVVPDQAIAITGAVLSGVVYDPSSDSAFGLDTTNDRIAKIDLVHGGVNYVDVTEPPAAACVDATRGRLFAVNQECSLVSEYRTSDLGLVDSFAWAGSPADPFLAEPEVYCAPDRLYFTDGAAPPGLFTLEDLDGTPSVQGHSGAPGVGGLAFDATDTDLYYWYRDAFAGGWTDTSIHHMRATDFKDVDGTDAHPPNIYRDPPTPIFLDESRGLILAKNEILNASDLHSLAFEIPENELFPAKPSANVYAFDPTRGRVATPTHVWSLDGYGFAGLTLVSEVVGSFFDRHGKLWSVNSTLVVSQSFLVKP